MTNSVGTVVQILTDVDDGFRLEIDAELLVAGVDRGVSRFETEFAG